MKSVNPYQTLEKIFIIVFLSFCLQSTYSFAENKIMNYKNEELTPMQLKVAKSNGTEPAFKNNYWDNKRPGIYVDILSGKPLFSSLDKFDSGTGWPSFTRPINNDEIVEVEDNSFFMKRIEVRSKTGDTHLGHVFTDGPKPTGLRYCMNSASLDFIAVEELEEKGYGEYKKLFDDVKKK